MTLQPPDEGVLRAWYAMQVRLADDDHYGHVNNAVYYEYFDTAINGWLTDTMGLSVRELPALGVVVASSCRYLRELHFPNKLKVGIAVARVGVTSVTYHPAIFRIESDGQSTLCAHGEFAHVYVDPQTRRPVPVPDQVRAALATAISNQAPEIAAATSE